MKRIACWILLSALTLEGAFRIVSYNVGSFSKYMEDSVGMVASMMREVGADAVCLNEVDSMTVRHKENQTELLATAMGGWNWHFGNTKRWNAGSGYGNSVLVKDDIIREHTVPLGFYLGSENRCIAVVETRGYVLGAVHLDHKSQAVRECQVKRIEDWVRKEYGGYSKPVILCGDFNDEPSSSVISLLMRNWEMLSSAESSFP